MYVDAETIITAASLVGALAALAGVLIAVYRFSQRPKELQARIEHMEKVHEEDIRRINEEQCLNGLKEKGCNGPVTEAINKIEKHLNKQAHDMEE